MKDDATYLRHILDCIAKVQQYTAGGREQFLGLELIQDAVLRNLQTLSEATQRLSNQAKAQHPHVQWQLISAFRNVLVHNYLGIDTGQVWKAVDEDLPELKAVAESLLRDLAQGDSDV